MSKTFLKMGCVALVAAGLALTASAAVTGAVKQLRGHVPSVVSKLVSTGQLDATNTLNLSIGLPLRNRETLTNLLQQIYDPSSTNFHHFLTPDEFTAQFGPTPEDYQAVLDFARTNGLTVMHTHGNRMVVGVKGKVSDVENSFHVTLRNYPHPTEARVFYAPSTEPSVPSNLPVLAIQGMNNYVLPHPMLHKMVTSNVKPATGSGPNGSYMGADFRNAYVPGTTLNGSGQVVGLLQFDGYYASDIATYEKLAGLTNVPLQNVLLDSFDGTPGANNDEVCLDIETSISMAPALSSVVVFEGGPYGNPNDILVSMVASNQIKQFSASWGYSIDGATEQLYQQMALQGQTFLNCSGDGDAWLGEILYGACEDPNITIVGGTTLTMNGNGVSYLSEKVLNWGFDYAYNWNPDGYFGSSGGISTDVSIPKWQQGISMATNHGSTTMRNVPDVALTGDNVFVVSSGGNEGGFGGTSCASPLFAGFMALVNQQAAINGKSSIGFLAPTVYALAKTASYTNIFHDIITGDNTWDLSPTNFFAVPGYDLCTGLGTPNGTNLINALAGVSNTYTAPIIAVTAPQAPWGTNLAALNGDNPNGPWFLFVQDTAAPLGGVISNGWFITLTTADPVGFAADNQLYATPATLSLAVGQSWNFTLAVTNYGPSISTNVYVTNNLPVGLTLVPNLPANVSVTGTWLTWNVGTLANNAGASLTLSFTNGLPGVIYTNSAGVFSVVTTDPNPDDDTIVATAVFQSQSAPNLTAFSYTQAGGFQFAVTNSPGQTVIIQASTNLVNWIPVYTNVEPFTYVNTDATNLPMRFYRAVTAQ